MAVVRAVTPAGAGDDPDPLEVIALNCGSSSVKGARYRVEASGPRRLAETAIEHLTSVERVGEAATRVLVGLAGDSPPAAIGHRLVHGGPTLRAPTFVDDDVLAELRRAVPFAPLHLPSALAALDAIRARDPGIAQVVCFDTTFHATLPETQWRLPIPRELADEGIRRYGFHGLSYEYVVGKIGAATLGRAVIAHLGNGASLCAVEDGRSVATTMGLTPTGGIPMGTRSGDLDPGVLVHLAREAGYDADRLDALVDRESGLLALGGASDMRVLLERRAAGDEMAEFAVEVFCLRVAMEIGAYAACLGSLDTVVFTAGIGERAPAVRSEICRRLAHLGVRLDDDRNERGVEVISDDEAVVTVRVVHTEEDAMIAVHTGTLLRS
jgi:acetate kinase